MKTPMQELIKWLKERHKHYSSQWEMDIVAGLEYAITHAESMLEKEKEQIVSAHINGQSEFDNGAYRQEVIDNAEQYYNETFNTKE
jgi:hypothetical protein